MFVIVNSANEFIRYENTLADARKTRAEGEFIKLAADWKGNKAL